MLIVLLLALLSLAVTSRGSTLFFSMIDGDIAQDFQEFYKAQMYFAEAIVGYSTEGSQSTRVSFKERWLYTQSYLVSNMLQETYSRYSRITKAISSEEDARKVEAEVSQAETVEINLQKRLSMLPTFRRHIPLAIILDDFFKRPTMAILHETYRIDALIGKAFLEKKGYVDGINPLALKAINANNGEIPIAVWQAVPRKGTQKVKSFTTDRKTTMKQLFDLIRGDHFKKGPIFMSVFVPQEEVGDGFRAIQEDLFRPDLPVCIVYLRYHDFTNAVLNISIQDA